jgi:hypothetical protein
MISVSTVSHIPYRDILGRWSRFISLVESFHFLGNYVSDGSFPACGFIWLISEFTVSHITYRDILADGGFGGYSRRIVFGHRRARSLRNVSRPLYTRAALCIVRRLVCAPPAVVYAPALGVC